MAPFLTSRPSSYPFSPLRCRAANVTRVDSETQIWVSAADRSPTPVFSQTEARACDRWPSASCHRAPPNKPLKQTAALVVTCNAFLSPVVKSYGLARRYLTHRFPDAAAA